MTTAPAPAAPQPQAMPVQPTPQPIAPLGVQTAPSNMPALSAPAGVPVANGQNIPSAGAVPAPVSSAPAVHPLYQDSMNMLSQVAQLGNPAQASNGQTTDQGVGGLGGFAVGFGKSAVSTLNNLSDLGQNALNQTAGRVGNLLSGKGFTAPTDKALIAPEALATHGTAENLGAGAEQIAELLAAPSLGAEDLAAKAGVSTTEALAGLGEKAATNAGTIANLAVKGAAAGAENAALGQLHNSQTPGMDFAFGAASPVIGAGISKLWDNATSIIGKTFNLPKVVQTLFETPDGKAVFQQGLKDVAANPQAPYVGLAHDVFQGMMDGKQAAKDAYQQGLEKVIQLTDGKTYNVSPQIKEISDMLKNEYGLPVQLARNADGTMSKDLKLVTDTPNGNPFSATETKNIEGLMNDMRSANGKSFKGLVNLQKNVNSYFDTDVFGNAKSTPYNSVIIKLSDIVDKKVSSAAGEAMPTMKAINEQYSQYKKIFNQFGKTFVDTTSGTPQVSTKAESFLSNFLGKNKAAVQDNVARELEQFTGVPILDRATGIKSAADMSQLAASGKLSQAQKILRSVGGAVGLGVGMAKGGIAGAFEGGYAGKEAGEIIGGIGKPAAGLKALNAVDKVNKILPKLPAGTGKVVGAAAKVGERAIANNIGSP